MRTTIRLDEDLLRAAKRLAVETDRTLTAVIEDALRRALGARQATPSGPELPTHGSGGTLPGVDLDDSAALLDVMDRR
ncbi:MAG: CopG family transcriptional regulator [Gaiellaceae bacterium]